MNFWKKIGTLGAMLTCIVWWPCYMIGSGLAHWYQQWFYAMWGHWPWCEPEVRDEKHDA